MSNPPTGPAIDWSALATHFTASASKIAGEVADQLKIDGPLLTSGKYDSKALAADVTWFWKTMADTATEVADCWTKALKATGP
jgi:hypothetical protein